MSFTTDSFLTILLLLLAVAVAVAVGGAKNMIYVESTI